MRCANASAKKSVRRLAVCWWVLRSFFYAAASQASMDDPNLAPFLLYDVRNTNTVRNPAQRHQAWCDARDANLDPIRIQHDEEEVKYTMDGFEEAKFTCTVDHFQLGFVVTKRAGYLVENCNSPDMFRPIAKAVGKEADIIPKVFKIWDDILLDTSLYEHLCLPDGSWRIKFKGDMREQMRYSYLKPLLASDIKAFLIILLRENSSSMFPCAWNPEKCNQRMMKNTVATIPMTASFGDLRRWGDAALDLNVPPSHIWINEENENRRAHIAKWGSLDACPHVYPPALQVLSPYVPDGEAPLPFLGYGAENLFPENPHAIPGKTFTKADYEMWLSQRKKGQKGRPLTTCIPDDCKVYKVMPLECLHAGLRIGDKQVDTAVAMIKLEQHLGLHELVVSTKLDLNKILPAEFKIPMQGLSGAICKKFQRDPRWVLLLLAPGLPADQELKTNSHEHFDDVSSMAFHLTESLAQADWLLTVLWQLEPSQSDIEDLFEVRALAYGAHFKKHFPTVKFNHYQHFLICHGVQFLKETGSGRHSTVVTESANKHWKFGLKRNASGRLKNQSVSQLAAFQARTAPKED